MSSPLLPFANATMLIKTRSSVEVIDGRIVSAEGLFYLVKAFLKRAESKGTETGSTKIPLKTQAGSVLPGASGDSFLYRGYALEYAVAPSTFELGVNSDSGLKYSTIKSQYSWMLPGQMLQLKMGEERILNGLIERSTGVFGGGKIDKIIQKEIGGMAIQITGGELIN